MINKMDEVFIYPTDTVWGIGCSLYSQIGFERIAEIKMTSKDKPISIMFTNVNQIYKYFSFSEEISISWLEEFFRLETTLGILLKNKKMEIPKWATGNSEYVSIRCLESEVTKRIYQNIQNPFFTTSLNLTGSPPIVSSEEAQKFQQIYAPDAKLVDSSKISEQNDLSGSSSTIVFINENLDFVIKREGSQLANVKKHLLKIKQTIF